MKRTEVTLTVNGAPGALVESVEIRTTVPLGYAQLLIRDDRACGALVKDLKEFLASKWKMLAPVVKLRDRRSA